ncbi:hypothetical protein [uncultured Helicobacter sp.]|uniref:hypothetical protein n=1 Tax=uncultured Helicobacter sp. TaxID=175537 RepID=UPI0037539780
MWIAHEILHCPAGISTARQSRGFAQARGYEEIESSLAESSICLELILQNLNLGS